MAGAAAQLVPFPVFSVSPLCVDVHRGFPPINFIYGHFHNSIRAELGLLAERVRSLETPHEGVESMLRDLSQRYKFLEQVYKYHSNVEDEVLYPALDSKVRNVTLAYSIEHQDEEILFEQLSQLLTKALEEPEASRKGTIRTLICKVEEIHTTLRKHLAKEEEQLLPLLLQHFNFAEQAELVAQFLYSIPLETVERVLSQLKPRIPRDEQEQLLIEIRNVIPDNLLSQLLLTWLQPAVESAGEPGGAGAPLASGPALDPAPPQPAASSIFVCCGNPEGCLLGPPSTAKAVPSTLGGYGPAASAAAAPNRSMNVAAVAAETPSATVLPPRPPLPRARPAAAAAAPSLDAAAAVADPTEEAGLNAGLATSADVGVTGRRRAPLQDIIHFHRSICSSLGDFAREARALQLVRDITAPQLSSLLDRHRFLRSVYVFHSISEEEVLFPEVQRLSAACVGGVAAQQCEKDHQAELSSFEDLGRLLADVRAFARRGRKEVAAMLEKLCCSAEAVHASIEHHMCREETDVFPLLEAHLCEAQQRVLVYRTIRAMPLRLLERVMPWVVSGLDHACAAAMLTNIRLGAPASDQALVELLSRWARRGRRGISPPRAGASYPPEPGHAASAGACAAGLGPRQGSGSLPAAWAGSSGTSGPGEEGGGDANATGLDAADAGGGSHINTSTCGPRFLRDSLPYAGSCGYVPTAVDEDGADRKRRRTSASALSDPQAPESEWVTARNSTLGVPVFGRTSAGGHGADGSGARAPTGVEELMLVDEGKGIDAEDDDAEQELSTAPRALLRCQASGSLDERGAGGGGGSAAAATAAAAGLGGPAGCSRCGGGGGGGSSGTDMLTLVEGSAVGGDLGGAGPHGAALSPGAGPGGFVQCGGGGGGGGGESGGGYNPIDHIFQFHKALRQELKQLEADAMTLEHAVLTRVRHQHHPHQHPHAQVQAPPRVPPPGLPEAGAEGASGVAGGVTTGGGVSGACNGGNGGGGGSRGGLLPIVQNFHGRFQFLQGIYRAHSKAEDEIVFPALEAKQALRNVSHAYTLDHRQEEHLFADLEQAIDNLRAVDLQSADCEDELLRQVMGVRRMCAAIRASLETHIRSEESELWPLFTEHFSREEQRYLVGVIIGRTGAQVLMALLPWVSETFSAEERDAMMDSLREATRNTMFDQWLEAVQAGAAGPGSGQGPGSFGGGSSEGAAGPSQSGSLGLGAGAGDGAGPYPQPKPHGAAACPSGSASSEPLQQVAQYLAGGGSIAAGSAGASPASGGPSNGSEAGGAGSGGEGSAGDSLAAFRPGWEDIFRMNQQQLEAAIHRVSNDSSLEPERKAYLMQNIMVSRYIVAQQRRMVQAEAASLQPHHAPPHAPTAQHAQHAQHTPAGGHPALPVQQHPQPHGGASRVTAGEAVSLPAATDKADEASTIAEAAPAPAATVAVVVTTAGARASRDVEAAGGAGGVFGPSGACGGVPLVRTFQNPLTGVLGCPHYQRRCQLVAPCCNQPFTCRLCHDEALDHRMDRYAVSEMLCMLCGTRQPVAGTCRCCAAPMARYVCNICHLFDDEPGKDIYHCPFCNVCRRGRGLGVDFFHCMNCNACMSLSLFSSHKCREKCIEGNCPVCHEALFDSSQPIKELPCGHFLHSSCFLTYTRYNYTCPLCCKSVGDMSVYFQMLDSLLASERLPPEYAGRMQQVLCNDCGKMGFAPFHFVYHSCPHCRSYNTRVL